MTMDETEPDLTEAELDARIAQSGLDLSPEERANILAMARYLQQAAALVRTYDPDAKRVGD
jgi:hypothetical protein